MHFDASVELVWMSPFSCILLWCSCIKQCLDVAVAAMLLSREITLTHHDKEGNLLA